jgi:hypothetical protein
MRLKEFLTESEFNDIEMSEYSKYLKYFSETKSFMWRGYGLFRTQDKDIFVDKEKVGRKPTDTPIEIHNWLNSLFHQLIGVELRGSSHFATFDENVASDYGNAFAIIPHNDAELYIIEGIRDMTIWICIKMMEFLKKTYPTLTELEDEFGPEFDLYHLMRDVYPMNPIKPEVVHDDIFEHASTIAEELLIMIKEHDELDTFFDDLSEEFISTTRILKDEDAIEYARSHKEYEIMIVGKILAFKPDKIKLEDMLAKI